jgi:predicted metal-dependent peptidase
MAVIDTSGSMRTPLLERIAREPDWLARSHRVTVVACDVMVHRTYPYRGRLRRVYGRGGTDLRPAFAAAVLSTIKPEVIVYFTDGYGPAPATAPGIPVVWCLAPGGQKPMPWGRAIILPEEPATL